MAKPPRMEYENVAVDVWINGEISEIQYEDSHDFPAVKGNPAKKGPACKIILSLHGYKHPKPSFWMWFSYGEQTKLFQTYISQLVEDAKPDMDFDLDHLKGFQIKAMYVQKAGKEYQNLSQIRTADGVKLLATNAPAPASVGPAASSEEEKPPIDDEEVPS